MRRNPLAPFLSLGLVLLIGAACRPGTMTTETGTSVSGSSSSTGSTSAATSTSAGATTSVGTGGGVDMGEGSLCSLILQDCPMGQKCVPYNMDGGIIPDGVKCVDEPSNPDAVGEICQVMGGFGSGEDSCIKGALCFDLDNDGNGVCIEHCSGTPDLPICQKSEESCVTFFDPPVPLCFKRCDPLVQDCGDGEGCYMDAPNIGSEGFVCMPTVLAPNVDGTFADLCFNQAGCAPGFSCIFPENVPGCKFEYCCSPWCDLVANPEICAELDPTMACVPWYEEGKAQPGFENVGICGIPL